MQIDHYLTHQCPNYQPPNLSASIGCDVRKGHKNVNAVNSAACHRLAWVGSCQVFWWYGTLHPMVSTHLSHCSSLPVVQHSGWFHIYRSRHPVDERCSRYICPSRFILVYICQLTSMTTATTDVQMEIKAEIWLLICTRDQKGKLGQEWNIPLCVYARNLNQHQWFHLASSLNQCVLVSSTKKSKCS